MRRTKPMESPVDVRGASGAGRRYRQPVAGPEAPVSVDYRNQEERWRRRSLSSGKTIFVVQRRATRAADACGRSRPPAFARSHADGVQRRIHAVPADGQAEAGRVSASRSWPTRASKKLGMTRRQFLATSGGMAACFLAMNEIFGRFFNVRPHRAVRTRGGGPKRPAARISSSLTISSISSARRGAIPARACALSRRGCRTFNREVCPTSLAG